MDLEHRVAIVTGAAGGIGRETALRLASIGADVVVADLDEEGAGATVAAVEGLGRRGLAIRTDVSEIEDIERLMDLAEDRLGRIDVLVNNAGVRHIGSILDETPESWNRTLAVDLTGTFFCMQKAVPAMRRAGGGKIVNVGSLTGDRGVVKRASYSAAKAGVHGLTRQAAAELAPLGIQVNAVAPGYIDTTIGDYDQAMIEAMLATSPTPRRGTPEEVAGAIAFLASPAADFLNGVILPVDGGVAASVLIDSEPFQVDWSAS
jgi:NAD(P)-dependent dehydrogenase (short-subunit alcohol dehydrogenase family)